MMKWLHKLSYRLFVVKRWFKMYYWNVKYDMPRNMERTTRDKIKWVILFPWYSILRTLARAGFLDTREGYYMRLRDFTPFFWRVLVKRAVRHERINLQKEKALTYSDAEVAKIKEVARAQGQEEVFNFLEEKIDQDFERT